MCTTAVQDLSEVLSDTCINMHPTVGCVQQWALLLLPDKSRLVLLMGQLIHSSSFHKKEESKGFCFKQLVYQVSRSYFYIQYSLYNLDSKDTQNDYCLHDRHMKIDSMSMDIWL